MSETIERPLPKFLSTKTLENILEISTPHAKRLIKNGDGKRGPIPSVKIGRSVRIKETDLMDWLNMKPEIQKK